MVDQYYRKIESIKNDIENAMKISGILLKLKGYDNKLGELSKIDTNEGKINNNENNISSNLEKIDNISEFILKSDKYFEKTYNIESQIFRFNKNNHFFSILEKEIEHDFKKNSLLFVKNNIFYKYDNLSNDYHRTQHEYNIYDNKDNLIHKYLFNKDIYYDENSDPILNTTEDFCICFKENYEKIEIVLKLHRHNRHGFGNINLEIDKNNNSYIKVDYIEKGISDNSDLINTNEGNISSNLGKINTNTTNISSNLSKMNTNTTNISSNLGKIDTNTTNISSYSGLISTNTTNISSNSGLISTNTTNISSNLEKINDLQNTNIKAFYNLDQIFIYDINPDPNYQTVNKDNHFHIFEKEITYNFTKNSYLEIALKVLTEVSHYMLIGYFQILCNFYDQDNNLFYTISLSTAMGSINKLSTIKSVFIVPINENISKIKIDFFIAPKETQQSRSATFSIKDINSNKIYAKYFQKTEEMSVNDFQDSLNTVKNISNELKQINTNKSDIKKLNNNIILKNIKNILFYNVKTQIDFKNNSYDKTFDLNIKKNDFIEIDLRMLLEYENINESNITVTEFKIFNDNDKEIYTATYNNSNYITFSNFVFINKKIFYNFEEDASKLRILIYFRMTKVEVVKIWYKPKNTDRFIIKHYGGLI